MTEPRNLIIRTDGTFEECLPENGEHYLIGELQAAIGGGYVQMVETNDGRVMWLDEEGKLKGFPPNAEATALYRYGPADPIVGDVLVCEEGMVE